MLYTVCSHLPAFPLLTSLVDVDTACRLVVDTPSAVETAMRGPAVVTVKTRVLGPAVIVLGSAVIALGSAVIALGSAVVASFTRLPVVVAAIKACVTQCKYIHTLFYTEKTVSVISLFESSIK